jgi:hypothetical protein
VRTGDRGGKVEDAKALKTPCQITLIVSRYCHFKLPRPLTFGHGVTLNCAACRRSGSPGKYLHRRRPSD